MHFWLIRHALVHPDSLTCLYGTNDVPICEATMAADAPRYARLAARLPRQARLVATPLTRTQLTAAALFRAGYPAQDLLIEPAFVEQDFGDWQGLPISSFDARTHEERHPFWPIHAAETPPNGESFDGVIARAGAALDRLAEDGPQNTIVFTHGGTIRALCAYALGLTAQQALHFSVDNISLTRLKRDRNGWRLISLNEHLSTPDDFSCQKDVKFSHEQETQGA